MENKKLEVIFIKDKESNSPDYICVIKEDEPHIFSGWFFKVNGYVACSKGKEVYYFDDFIYIGFGICKWDGCSHWYFTGEDIEDHDSYYHICGSHCYTDFVTALSFIFSQGVTDRDEIFFEPFNSIREIVLNNLEYTRIDLTPNFEGTIFGRQLIKPDDFVDMYDNLSSIINYIEGYNGDLYWKNAMKHRMEKTYEIERLITIAQGNYLEELIHRDNYCNKKNFIDLTDYDLAYFIENAKRPYGNKDIEASIAFNLGWDSKRRLEKERLPEFVKKEALELHQEVIKYIKENKKFYEIKK